MIKIIVFKLKIIKKSPIEILREQVGTIEWKKNGTLDVQAITHDIESLINKAIARVEFHGVHVKWSEKTNEKRIIEYEKRIKPDDHKYPDLLAEQLFDQDTKLKDCNLVAMTEEKYKKAMSQWEEIGENVYRSRFKEEDYLNRANNHLEANEYLFIGKKIDDNFRKSDLGKAIAFFSIRCSEIIAEDRPRSHQEKPSILSFNRIENHRKKDRLNRYKTATKLLNFLKTFEAVYFKEISLLESHNYQLRKYISNGKMSVNQIKRYESKIQREKSSMNSMFRSGFKKICKNNDNEDLNMSFFIINQLQYRSLDDFLDKMFPL